MVIITDTEQACGVTEGQVEKCLMAGLALVREATVFVANVGGPALLTAIARNALENEKSLRDVEFVGFNSFGHAIFNRFTKG